MARQISIPALRLENNDILIAYMDSIFYINNGDFIARYSLEEMIEVYGQTEVDFILNWL